MNHFLSDRARNIEPFHVIELLTRAQQLTQQGRDIIHMEVGEPDFPTPAPVIEAAQRFLADGNVRYTPALGLPELRQAIADFYASKFGVNVPAQRIAVTAGASGALLLALAALTNPGDEWLLPDPGYPCNRNFVGAFSGQAKTINVLPENNFQPSITEVTDAWTSRTRGLMVASPANPTGTLLTPEQLQNLEAYTRNHNAHLIVDEIYQGLTYDTPPSTALSLSDHIFVVNSFSKYFGMTGWRLGWLVMPAEYSRTIEKLAQHYFIAPSAPAQYAALAAFSSDNIAILEERRSAFKRRRDVLVPGLEKLGFRITAKPQGAFYVYADVSHLCDDSHTLAYRLLEEAGVATTPGLDFGQNAPSTHLRLAYTTSRDRIGEALERIRATLER